MEDGNWDMKGPVNEDELAFLRDVKSVDVDTGEVRVSSEPVTLRAVAIGSCIAVMIYDRHKKIGGLAHIMLPGRSAKGPSESRTKYAEDAIDFLFDTVKRLGAKTSDLEISVVGGANILQEGDIPDKVVKSVLDYLKKLNVKWNRKRVGGTERRSVFLDTTSGRIFYTEGDNTARVL